MRKFKVWLDKSIVGVGPYEELVEMPDNATDEECTSACLDCLDTMISNHIETGWEEVT